MTNSLYEVWYLSYQQTTREWAYFCVFCDSRIAALALRLPPSFGPRGTSGLAALGLVFFVRPTRRRDWIASTKSLRNCSAIRSSAACLPVLLGVIRGMMHSSWLWRVWIWIHLLCKDLLVAFWKSSSVYYTLTPDRTISTVVGIDASAIKHGYILQTIRALNIVSLSAFDIGWRELHPWVWHHARPSSACEYVHTSCRRVE